MAQQRRWKWGEGEKTMAGRKGPQACEGAGSDPRAPWNHVDDA